MFLANSNIDNGQRISVLAASAPDTNDLGNNPTTDDFLKAMKYDSVAAVLRQCEVKSKSDHEATDVHKIAEAITANDVTAFQKKRSWGTCFSCKTHYWIHFDKCFC